ncbi:hypothetical protein AX15_004302 [Amanita polypyramis BW_CC]|nr:hypothetical protein AX15_004302 [Amanita polypyramis BW_CC]
MAADTAVPSTEFDSLQHPQRSSERFSIDLSLELEHQLEHMESLSDPPSSDPSSSKAKHDSLDPHVLAHIIMQLRHSLAEMTKERDELVKALSSALSKEAELNDALQLMTDKATGLEEELTGAKKKIKEEEEAITMLRSKVEESRRGLMRLQTESRRQSGNFESIRGALPLTLTSAAAAASPPTSKRASFAPLHAGRSNGHRRISSVSDTNVIGQMVPPDLTGTSPRTQDFPALDVPNPRRVSGIFGHQSPAVSYHVESSQQQHDDALTLELESLKKDLQAVREELENTKHELSESNEAKEASETCAKALREFIAENNIGVREIGGPPSPIKLPPPPAATTGEEATETHKTMGSGGWSFGKLWKADHSARTPSVASIASPIVASTTPQTPQLVSASTPTPLTKKLGSFFSSRSSISLSAPSATSGGGSTPLLQSNAAVTTCSHRGSVHSFSDASSITEPISPSSEPNGVTGAAKAESIDIGYPRPQGSSGKDVEVNEEGQQMVIVR